MRKNISLLMNILVLSGSLVMSDVTYANQYSLPVEGTEVVIVTQPKIQELRQVLGKLNLTPAQRLQIRTIIVQAESQFRDYMNEDVNNSVKLSALWDDNYDENAIKTLSNAQGKIAANVINLRWKVRHDIYEILTSQQKLQLKNIPY